MKRLDAEAGAGRRFVVGAAAGALLAFVAIAPLAWRFRQSEMSAAERGDAAPFGDVDGDGRADLIALEQAADGSYIWQIQLLTRHYSSLRRDVALPGQLLRIRFGAAPAVPVLGDFNGDGIGDLGTFSPHVGGSWERSEPNWQLGIISTSPPDAPLPLWISRTESFSWGLDGSIPVPEDYDGDGATDLAVFEPGSTQWHALLSGGGFRPVEALVGREQYGWRHQWGLPGDLPLPGDYDGNGLADLAVVRTEESGELSWHVMYLARAGEMLREPVTFRFGRSGDVPLNGDFDGNGTVEPALFRPETGEWVLRSGEKGATSFRWSIPGAVPFVADFDGDGRTDPALFDPHGREHYHLLTSRLRDAVGELLATSPPAISRLRWGGGNQFPANILLRQHQARSAADAVRR